MMNQLNLVYEFLLGPMMWVTLAVFLGGLAWQVVRFFRLSRPSDPPLFQVAFWNAPQGEAPVREGVLARRLHFVKFSILGVRPWLTLLSFVFHLLLFVVPIFLLAHNLLLYESWRLRLVFFSEPVSDILTLVFLGCGAVFFMRRIFSPTVRAITSLSDLGVLFIVLAPFLTGFLAYHQIFEYRLMLVLHVLAGEVMLMAIPFTKLMHMIYFFLNRIFIVHENSFGYGSRTW